MKFKPSSRTIPFVLIAVCGAAFGSALFSLAHYQDDWPIIYYQYAGGTPGLWDLHLYQGRPYSAFVYAGLFALNPAILVWHMLLLSLRAATVLVVWKVFQAIWPEHPQATTWAALLFAVYPLFKLQPLAVTFMIHWLAYLCYAISVWAMVQSVRFPRRFWPYLFLAVLTNGLHVLLVEYFAGIEIARLLILWLLLGDHESFRKRLVTTLKYWSPYFLVLVGFVLYRIVLIPRPYLGFYQDPPQMIFDFLKNPVATSVNLLEFALKDASVTLVSAWSDVFGPDYFQLTQPANLKALFLAALVGAGLFVYLRRLNLSDTKQTESSSLKSMLVVGGVLTVTGPLPAWITYQTISANNPLWSNRFGLGAMLGASLLVVALLGLLVENQRSRTIIFCTLIGATVGWHALYTNDYRWSATKQARFYYQLYWRAPYIEPGTAILSDGEIFSYMGEYPTSLALNTLYPQPAPLPDLKYWFFSVPNHFADALEDLNAGIILSDHIYSAQFSGDSRDALVISYEPEKNQCLWMLRPEDYQIRILSGITRDIVSISNLNRIHPEALDNHTPDPDIFGPEVEHTWCYYYQKADLARQEENWSEIVALWNVAAEAGYDPPNGVEYIPFIEGFAHTGNWNTAAKMTLQADRITHVMPPQLCLVWQDIERTTDPSDARIDILAEVRDNLDCPE